MRWKGGGFSREGKDSPHGIVGEHKRRSLGALLQETPCDQTGERGLGTALDCGYMPQVPIAETIKRGYAKENGK